MNIRETSHRYRKPPKKAAKVDGSNLSGEGKKCLQPPQYMLRTDEMEYHVRPLDHKHPVILPVGKEGEFKISKDVMEMRIPDGDHKNRRYQVVAMKPIDHSESFEDTKANYEPRKDYKDYADKALDAKTSAQKSSVKTTPEPASPPQ